MPTSRRCVRRGPRIRRALVVGVLVLAASVAPAAAGASTGWWTALAPDRPIEGYADAVSAAPGDRVGLRVHVPSGAAYRVRVLRLDDSAEGATDVACRPTCGVLRPGVVQPPPAIDPVTNEIRAPWSRTDVLRIGRDWPSGYYGVLFEIADGPRTGAAGWTPLIVRRAPTAAPAPVLVEIPISTWQAYNDWGGLSAYSGGPWSDVVSFDRPYKGGLLGWEYPLLRFLERHGYDADFQTDLDTDRDPGSLLRHRLVIVNGHDEYWTPRTSEAFYEAKRRGVNLAFFGANIGYWRTRLSADRRSLAIYKRGGDPEYEPAIRTGYYRDTLPECHLMGVQHQGGILDWTDGAYTVDAEGVRHRWFRGSGFRPGDEIAGVVSVEVDTEPNSFAVLGKTCPSRPLTVLFRRDMGGDTLGDARAVTYVARSGARIFSAGSLNLTWALDDVWQRWLGQPSLVNRRMQRFVRTMLDGMSGRQEASSR